jgi:hypothetical protein
MIPQPQPTAMKAPYHNGGKYARGPSVSPERRPFIAWDGEGINLRGTGKPQSYVLFGSSEGSIENTSGLSVFECLDHIIETGRRFPNAFHVGFAFTYDANMIVKGLAPMTLLRLHKNGYVRIKQPSTGREYTITFARGKYFRVTRYQANYDRKSNPYAKTTVQIFDIFAFFASSFIKAYESTVGPVPDIIREGKAGRATFSVEEMDDVKRYWSVEIQMLKGLAEELRRRIYGAGIRITQWHGPGALASKVMGTHGIKGHMARLPEEIRMAARYGYAGGRFELFKIGRVSQPIYGVDINSAYPFAIAQLPSLIEGTWDYEKAPERISKFGIYHVVLSAREKVGFAHSPSPLFHRDMDHNISFPWFTEGWYFGPEANLARRLGAEIIEGYHFYGAKSRPFSWIQEMYETRKDWKRRGLSSQLALKLCMNSIYGKLAQRVGWDEKKRRMPPFHQLEWAGWVTSFTRAKLYDVMMRIPFEDLIAVETDGIYTTKDPASLGIEHSEELGGWEVSRYEELLYVQSGLAWLRDSKGDWTDKRRGLDPGSFSLDAATDYLATLGPRDVWQPYVGQTTRFVGLGQALASSRPTSMRHCVWETNPREISPGQGGKRIHIHKMCTACQNGANAYEAPHDLVIRSMSFKNRMSVPHSIPWEPEVGHALWRDTAESDGEYDVTSQYV